MNSEIKIIHSPESELRKRTLCKDPETCPFCQAGILRQVMVPMYDMETGQTIMFTMPEKTYNKIMGKKGGENVS